MAQMNPVPAPANVRAFLNRPLFRNTSYYR
jgi:hypothetical protein